MATSFSSSGIGFSTFNPVTPPTMPGPGNILAFAYDRSAAVDTYVAGLQNAVLSLVAPTITPEFPAGGAAPAIVTSTPPTFEPPVWVSPAIPSNFTEALDVSDLSIEPFDAEAPNLVFGSAPAPFVGSMPDAPAVNLQFDDPTLNVNMPAPPNLLTISINKFGGMNLPTFDEQAPTLDIVAPTIRDYTPGDDYTSGLLTALQTTLQDRIINGGTGLGQAAETAIWERGKEREARSQAEAIARLEQMEELGYPLPPGIYLDARTKIITETDYAERGHSREVMIESARLELDNVKHALTTATQLEGQLMDYSNSVEQRLFESTRYATEAGISIYNARVQAFTSMVEVYRTKAQVYEIRVRAETAKVEAYRAEVAAEEAKASVNRALVDQYRAEIEAALSSIEIYKAQIAGIQAKADIERTKVMVFGEQVRGYVAQINAYTAGVEGYRASLQAEQTKQQTYQSQVEAFSARVRATTAQIESRIAAYRGRIEAKTAEWEGYKAQVQGEASRVQALAQTNGVVADAYRAEVQALSSYNDVLTKQWQATLDQQQRTAEIGINAAKANAELYVTTRSLAMDAAKTGATVAAQLGAAAINAVNYSTSLSSAISSSTSTSQSSSVSVSTSTSQSNSTAHNYSYSV